MVGIRGNHPQMESNGHQPDDMSLSENLGEHPHLQWTIIIAASLSKLPFEETIKDVYPSSIGHSTWAIR